MKTWAGLIIDKRSRAPCRRNTKPASGADGLLKRGDAEGYEQGRLSGLIQVLEEHFELDVTTVAVAKRDFVWKSITELLDGLQQGLHGKS